MHKYVMNLSQIHKINKIPDANKKLAGVFEPSLVTDLMFCFASDDHLHLHTGMFSITSSWHYKLGDQAYKSLHIQF